MANDKANSESWEVDMSKGDIQCPFIVRRDDGSLNCRFSVGHPGNHEARSGHYPMAKWRRGPDIANDKFDEPFRIVAKREYVTDEIEIDNEAKVSRAYGNPDGGAWVAAWVWVSDEDVKNYK